jgi:sphingosine kinase
MAMAPVPPRDDDPFRDPHGADTLAIDSQVTLTLAADGLHVNNDTTNNNKNKTPGNDDDDGGDRDGDDELPARRILCCCLPNSNQPSRTRQYPYSHILWAALSDHDGVLSIDYAHEAGAAAIRPAALSFRFQRIDKADATRAHAWITRLLARAYGASQQGKRIKVLVNPFGGQGAALKTYHKTIAPIFAAARCELHVQPTQHQGHAITIAEELDIDAFDVVMCCSGDGIPHEVFNGLARRPDAARALAKVAVVQMPCGSGNAMSLNFNGSASPSLAALAAIKGLRTPLDLASVTQGDRRTLSFLSQSVGIVAETDLATEHMRWMGSTRFTVGFLTRFAFQTVYPADIAIKAEHSTKQAVRDAYRAEAEKPSAGYEERPLPDAAAGLPPLRYGTINDPLPVSWDLIPHDQLGNFYAGNIAYMSPDANFFPASLPADGCLDLVRIRGDLPRLTAIKTLLAVEDHSFFDLDHVDYQKISAYRIIPKNQRDGYISIDGERIPFEPFQVEVHRGLGTVLSKSGRLCEAKGV